MAYHQLPLLCSVMGSHQMTTHTQKIFRATAPYANGYQGPAKRLLFVCSVGLLRSPTAADVATKLGYNARSCGSDVSCALIPLSANLICWSDKIIFVNMENYREAEKYFDPVGYWQDDIVPKAIVWNLPDEYARNDEWLISLIENKMKELE